MLTVFFATLVSATLLLKKLPAVEPAKVATPSATPSTCTICETVMMMAHVFAQYENLNATALNGELGEVCAFLPQSYQSQCNVMVSAFGLTECQCITQPTSTFNATSCCSEVALCADNIAKSVAMPSQCDVCESAVTTANLLASYEGWNATTLQSQLGVVCAYVPMQYQQQCKTLISTFGVIEAQCITAKNFTAQTCCADVGLCANIALTTSVTTTNYCSPCKVVATAAHYLLEAYGLNTTAVENDLVTICNFVPSANQAECQDVISVAGDEVVSCVANSTTFDAQSCCFDAGLCATSSRVRKGLALKI